MIKRIKDSLKLILSNIVKIRVSYTGQKRGTKFNIKDKTKYRHLVYYSKCPEPTCKDGYLGKTIKRI